MAPAAPPLRWPRPRPRLPPCRTRWRTTTSQLPSRCLWLLRAPVCVVSCRVVSCRVVSCRVVSCRVVSCRVVSCRVVSCACVRFRVCVVCALWVPPELIAHRSTPGVCPAACAGGGGSGAAASEAGAFVALPSLPDGFQGLYELFAVVTHKGRSADSGHYMGWVRRDGGALTLSCPSSHPGLAGMGCSWCLYLCEWLCVCVCGGGGLSTSSALPPPFCVGFGEPADSAFLSTTAWSRLHSCPHCCYCPCLILAAIVADKWDCYDDNVVSECHTSDVLQLKGGGDYDMASMLFYRAKGYTAK